MAKKTIITEIKEEDAPIQPLAYSINNAARALDISRSSLLDLITAKKIKTVYVGRKPIIPVENINNFLRNESK